jgi:multisubunit Na+/H+ antiporter MnhG subunit
MSKRGFALWYFMLGAGFASGGIILMSHLLLGKPQWWKVLLEEGGYTIYPPLSALPQTTPGCLASVFGIMVGYPDLLAGAVLCGLLFVGAWLATLLFSKLDNSKLSYGFWLSVLLLVPVGSHLYGQARFAAEYQKSQQAIQDDYDQARREKFAPASK